MLRQYVLKFCKFGRITESMIDARPELRSAGEDTLRPAPALTDRRTAALNAIHLLPESLPGSSKLDAVVGAVVRVTGVLPQPDIDNMPAAGEYTDTASYTVD